jgi:hypothetical protein
MFHVRQKCILVLLSIFCSPLPSAFAQNNVTGLTKKQTLPVVFALEGFPPQAAIDFYKEVYKSLARSSRWEVMPIGSVRKALGKSSDDRLGGIPTIDRQEFRSKLPRKHKRAILTSGKTSKLIPGKPVPQLQRFLDNTRSSAVLVVDCARLNQQVIKACALYYYDRVSSRVIASAVKEFLSGANDVTNWADPMLKTLDEGLEAAQREKDQEVIEELVARNEDDEEGKVKGVFALYGKGDRAQLNDGFKQTISGFGLQLGFLDHNVGAVVDAGILSWRGSGERWKKAQRTHYGINMLFRARALESLLWYLEIGGGKEKTIYSGIDANTKISEDGLYTSLAPGMGLELAEFVTLNVALSWRWFFDSSTERNGVNSNNLKQTESRIPGLILRGMILL